jgi:hypothetical protein
LLSRTSFVPAARRQFKPERGFPSSKNFIERPTVRMPLYTHLQRIVFFFYPGYVFTPKGLHANV